MMNSILKHGYGCLPKKKHGYGLWKNKLVIYSSELKKTAVKKSDAYQLY